MEETESKQDQPQQPQSPQGEGGNTPSSHRNEPAIEEEVDVEVANPSEAMEEEPSLEDEMRDGAMAEVEEEDIYKRSKQCWSQSAV